jgi:tripartite-type tricarboxylate transporter receptor subunit TctC
MWDSTQVRCSGAIIIRPTMSVPPPAAVGTTTPLVVEVNPSVPAKTIPEFIAYARGNACKINLATPGVGTPPHVAGELFKMMTGVDMVHV